MIKLNEEVVVSDPCYSMPTWCQHVVKNVLPGEYESFALGTEKNGPYGFRIAALQVIHKDYLDTHLNWRKVSDQIGVDSGQCGIFSAESYRNDEVEIERPVLAEGFAMPFNDQPGDSWYESMCHFTLGDERWGDYSEGVVSASGFGDGVYTCKVAKDNGKVVGIMIDYLLYKLNNESINNIQYTY